MSDQSSAFQTLHDDDKPREKLLTKGVSALSNSELLAILLRTGTKHTDVMSLSKKILQNCDYRLDYLGNMSLASMTSLSGLGKAKACTIISAMELGRRSLSDPCGDSLAINSSSLAFNVLKPHLLNLDHEEFWVLYLSNANKIIAKKCISMGGLTGTVADTRIILRGALECKATSLILAHNHPSGTLRPSMADEQLTKRIVDAGKIMEIQVLDHLIVGGRKYFSFADEGLIIHS